MPGGIAFEGRASPYGVAPAAAFGWSVELRSKSSAFAYRFDAIRATNVRLSGHPSEAFENASANAVESFTLSVRASPSQLCRVGTCLYGALGGGLSLFTLNAIQVFEDYYIEMANQHPRRCAGRLGVGLSRSVSRVPITLEVADAITRGIDPRFGEARNTRAHQLSTMLSVGWRFSK